MHKDIKPDNILFDDQGFMRIADYGISESTDPEVNHCFAGTECYRAPEVVQHQQHEASVDYYALGMIAYRCMFRKFPYSVPESIMRKQLRKGIFQSVQLTGEDLPKGFSPLAADFINKLLEINPEQRLGFNGQICQLK